MDSVSQFVLGAAIGEATLGQRIGRKAMLLGGLLGTLPDLDVIVQYSDAVASFTYHRSWSHSLFVLVLASFPIAWLLARYFPKRWSVQSSALQSGAETSQVDSPHYKLWLLFVLAILLSHPVLDGFTVYGTQLLWPLPVEPIAWGSIFIIDPLYTVPIIIGLVVAYKNRRHARKALIIGLLVSTAYLGLTLFLQQHMKERSLQALQAQDLGTENVLIAPTPLSLLWRIVSMDGGQYHEGFASILDTNDAVLFSSYESNRDLIEQHKEHWSIARMDWFTAGRISADQIGDELVINDLRMGIESSYIFRFSVGRLNGSAFEPLESQAMPIVFDTERMRMLIRRVWDENVILDST